MSTAFASVSAIAEAGYKYFLIMQLPPIDRTPGNVANAAAGQPLSPNTTQVVEYNTALAAAADDFAKQYSVQTFVFDTYSFLGRVIDNAADYGIKNTTGYCPSFDAPDISVNYTSYGCLPIPEYFWYSKYPEQIFDLEKEPRIDVDISQIPAMSRTTFMRFWQQNCRCFSRINLEPKAVERRKMIEMYPFGLAARACTQ